MKRMTNVLFIDNFDSFTYNLVDEFRKRGCSVNVYRNNTPLEIIHGVVREFKPRLIVVSPGPSRPIDAGNSNELIKLYAGVLPIFGVCLGHQCSIEAFGGKVERAPEILHGKPSRIVHDGKTIFKGVEQNFQAGRYHSLCGTRVPGEFEVSARTANDIVMGVRHKKYFIEGIQFHPESILTPQGGRIIENLIDLVRKVA